MCRSATFSHRPLPVLEHAGSLPSALGAAGTSWLDFTSGLVEGGKVAQYRVTIKVGFTVNPVDAAIQAILKETVTRVLASLTPREE